MKEGGHLIHTFSWEFQIPGAGQVIQWFWESKYGADAGHWHLKETVLSSNPAGQAKHCWVLVSKYELGGQDSQSLVSEFHLFGATQATQRFLALSRGL
jgi:hypothetical protein